MNDQNANDIWVATSNPPIKIIANYYKDSVVGNTEAYFDSNGRAHTVHIDIDGNSVAWVHTAGFDSPVASKEDHVVNAAGATTTTYTDTSGDGLWDKQHTAYDADSNGKAVLVVKSIYGGAATYSYDANQNGQFENITIAQANGRFDITQTDESGAATPWKTIETHYASAGVLDDQRIVWDNNSTWLNDWDQAASQSLSYQSTQYTASGQADLQTIDCDAAGKSFGLSTTVYAHTGAVDWQTVRMDGSYFQALHRSDLDSKRYHRNYQARPT